MEAERFLRHRLVQWLVRLLFPDLRRWPLDAWAGLLAKANEGEFDRIERLGIVAAVVLTSSYLQAEAMTGVAPMPAFMLQFLLALPVLSVLAGPFFVRRIRRRLMQAASEAIFSNEPRSPGSSLK